MLLSSVLLSSPMKQLQGTHEGKADNLLMAILGTASISKLSPCETLIFQPSQLFLGANNADFKKILIPLKLLLAENLFICHPTLYSSPFISGSDYLKREFKC